MSAVQPYRAWLFDVDYDADQVAAVYARLVGLRLRPDPATAIEVEVVALESTPSGDAAWVLRPDGEAEFVRGYRVRAFPDA